MRVYLFIGPSSNASAETSGYIMNCTVTDKSLLFFFFYFVKERNSSLLNPPSMLDMKSVTTGLEPHRVAWVHFCGAWRRAMAQSLLGVRH